MENSPLQALFTSDIGLLSLFTIGFIVVMAVYLFFFVRRHIREDTLANNQTEQKPDTK